jgi:predicted secreted protein
MLVRFMPWRIGLTTITMFSFLVNFTPGFAMAQGSLDSLTITEKDNKGHFQIALGGILTVKLDVIPGTGYAWYVVENDPTLLKPMGESFFEPKIVDPRKKIVGAPEDQVFRFRAQAKGGNILSIECIRKWEKRAAPLKTFSVTLQIN